MSLSRSISVAVYYCVVILDGYKNRKKQDGFNDDVAVFVLLDLDRVPINSDTTYLCGSKDSSDSVF